MEGARKSSKNPLFNSSYAGLGAVWSAIRGPLSRNGLAVIQLQTTGPGENAFVEVETTLVHSSGEWVSGALRLPAPGGGAGLQSFGAALTYARRYGLQAMVGIAPLDEGGNAAGEARSEESRDLRGRESSEGAFKGEASGSGGFSGESVQKSRRGAGDERFFDRARMEIDGSAGVEGLNAWADRHRMEIASLPEKERALLREMFTVRRNELGASL
jgi:hypothetical protein